MTGASSFSKTICSICYEDLKPIVEDLQSISICGHVFHELCLQQWFEYCLNSTKKYNCPVCKRNCVGHNATRLYFQSLGDQAYSSLSQKPIDREDVEALQGEVKRLGIKLSAVSSILERQEKENNVINEELCLCKEQIKKETALKNEALRENAFLRQQLNSNSKELSKSNSECSQLEQRNLALAKEIAVLKLVSDLDLEKDEILRIASLGNQANSQATVDNLILSLASHKKSYKELLAKCNLLGRGEARLLKKLEKATKKIEKLKTIIQESETSIEIKDNEHLRAFKSSKKIDVKGATLKIEDTFNSSTAKISSKEHPMQEPILPLKNFSERSPIDSPSLMKENVPANHVREEPSTLVVLNGGCNPLMDEDAYRLASLDFKRQNFESIVQESAASKSKFDSLVGFSGSRTFANSDNNATFAAATKYLFNIKTETQSSPQFSQHGNTCFSSGLIGPDGMNGHLGKWCKRGKVLGSLLPQGPTKSSGGLISVGADGRGGRVKVLRSVNQSSLDGKENSVGAKRLRHGTKTNTRLQSQGCLQMEHFFGKAR